MSSKHQGQSPRILFLDQSGSLGGAELCLLDIARQYRDRSMVCLFTDGNFRIRLEQEQIPVQVLATEALQVRKESGLLEGLKSLKQLLPMANAVAHLSREFDILYANTQKALVVGAIASLLGRRPLVYHLHDILSPEHFSATNRRLAVTLANQFATRVIATSEAAREAFIAAGGRADRVTVIYNGFDPKRYQLQGTDIQNLKQQLGLEGRFVVGSFSRLSPWKGQHVLIEAIAACPNDVVALLVGDALYGEQDYVTQIKAQVEALNLQERVRFLGFRSDVVPLMHACDVVVHTSTAPEPFGRVIAEAMLCGRPVIAAEAGGVKEVVSPGKTGWLIPPENPQLLTATMLHCRAFPEVARAIAQQGQLQASQRFHIDTIHAQIEELLSHEYSDPLAHQYLPSRS